LIRTAGEAVKTLSDFPELAALPEEELARLLHAAIERACPADAANWRKRNVRSAGVRCWRAMISTMKEPIDFGSNAPYKQIARSAI
jgi:hypothetical protein